MVQFSSKQWQWTNFGVNLGSEENHHCKAAWKKDFLNIKKYFQVMINNSEDSFQANWKLQESNASNSLLFLSRTKYYFHGKNWWTLVSGISSSIDSLKSLDKIEEEKNNLLLFRIDFLCLYFLDIHLFRIYLVPDISKTDVKFLFHVSDCFRLWQWTIGSKQQNIKNLEKRKWRKQCQ